MVFNHITITLKDTAALERNLRSQKETADRLDAENADY